MRISVLFVTVQTLGDYGRNVEEVNDDLCVQETFIGHQYNNITFNVQGDVLLKFWSCYFST